MLFNVPAVLNHKHSDNVRDRLFPIIIVKVFNANNNGNAQVMSYVP